MSQKEAVRNEIIAVAQAGLERRKCLLVVLQRVDTLASATVRETECRDSHDSMGKLK